MTQKEEDKKSNNTMGIWICPPIQTFVMTKEEHSKHIDLVLKNNENPEAGEYCSCIWYDDSHHIVETEKEKLYWIRQYKYRHQRGNFYEELPMDAKLVALRSRWGNIYKVKEWGREKALEKYHEWLHGKLKEDPDFLKPLYIDINKKEPWRLSCYCDLREDCHADILLMHMFGECK